MLVGRPVLLLVLALLGSCSRIQLVFVVNQRDAPLQVTYRNDTWNEGEQRDMRCPLGHEKPRLLKGTRVENFSWDDVRAVAHEYDESRCEIRLTLPPGDSVIIGMNEFCSKATEHIGREGLRPRLNYLRIEDGSDVVEFSGWEVSRHLQEKRGPFSRWYCRYEVR